MEWQQGWPFQKVKGAKLRGKMDERAKLQKMWKSMLTSFLFSVDKKIYCAIFLINNNFFDLPLKNFFSPFVGSISWTYLALRKKICTLCSTFTPQKHSQKFGIEWKVTSRSPLWNWLQEKVLWLNLNIKVV